MENKFNDKAYYETLLKKYLDNQCTESELKIVSELLTDSTYRDVLPELLHRASFKFHSEFKMEKEHGEALWSQVSNEIYALDRDAKNKNLVFSMTRIAASIILVLGAAVFSYLYFSSGSGVAYVTKTTDRGQRLTFLLADGSKVKLNSESTITYPERFEGDIREIQLSGEAFFEVKKDPNKPFVVISDNINTEVLGTSFNVRAFPDENIVVTVSSGKVNVSTEKMDFSSLTAVDSQRITTIVLTAGEQATYHISRQYLTRSAVSLAHHTGWQDGILRFNETPLGEVAEILQRWYDVEIRFENDRLSSCKVTSSFNGETIEEVLEELKFIFKLNYTIDNQNIAISGKGCE